MKRFLSLLLLFPAFFALVAFVNLFAQTPKSAKSDESVAARLQRFEDMHPDIDVRISASHRMFDFERDGIDLAIRHGLGGYEGLISERLVDDELVPICTPGA